VTDFDPASPAAELVDLLIARRETVATAESLTGGLIGVLLTAVPGASQVYRGGVISYATELKAELAGVSPLTLQRWGPVAAATAEEMAVGVARRCAARHGLSATGVAGPDAQDGHPVGLVFVGSADTVADHVVVHEHRLSGSRAAIRRAAAELALRLLLEQLRIRDGS
jgi:nicotinamide-nucleotide amidase